MDRRPPIFVPKPYSEPSKTPTGEMKALKRSNFISKLVIGCVGAIATAGVTGFIEWRGEKTDTNSSQVEVRTDQKLADHIVEDTQWKAALTTKLEEDSEARTKTREDVAVIKAMMELELKQHGIPRSRFPHAGDVEPAVP